MTATIDIAMNQCRLHTLYDVKFIALAAMDKIKPILFSHMHGHSLAFG